jgi:hypothetical protein
VWHRIVLEHHRGDKQGVSGYVLEVVVCEGGRRKESLHQPEDTERNHDKLIIAIFPTDIRNRDPRIRRRNANRYTKTLFMQLQVKRLYIFECIEKSNSTWLKLFVKISCGILRTALPKFVTVYEPVGCIKSGELSYYVKSWTCTNLHSVGSILT